MDWERKHPYRRNRLKKLKENENASVQSLEEKYAESAMRGIGFGKPNDRRRMWPDCVRAMGLTVEIKSIPSCAKLLLKSDRSVEAQISRFLYQGVDMIQEGKDFNETLKELGCTPRNIFSWLKRQRKDFQPKIGIWWDDGKTIASFMYQSQFKTSHFRRVAELWLPVLRLKFTPVKLLVCCAKKLIFSFNPHRLVIAQSK